MSRPSRGFTVIELVTVVAIIAITLTIGLPSLLEVIRINQMTTRTNDFIAAVSLARSEATRRNRAAEICARASDTACAGGSDGSKWADGWIVWADANDDGSLDAPDEVMRIGAPTPNINVAGTLTAIRFDRRGLAVGLPAAAANRRLELRHSACEPGKPLQRGLEFSTIGRLTALREDCT